MPAELEFGLRRWRPEIYRDALAAAPAELIHHGQAKGAQIISQFPSTWTRTLICNMECMFALALAPAGKDVGAPHTVVLAARYAALPHLPRPSPAHSHPFVRLLVLSLALSPCRCPPSSTASSHAAILASLTFGTVHHTLAAHLHAVSGSSLTALIGHAGHVKELWQDMVALELYDVPLWEVVLGALNLAAAQ
ncbi:hypothetical protein C8R44DRAFT_872302 [Mycena epipterygia]|nr:hypothetical protein C8R44DRAFT_872302 [Mycena epipterygia]